MALLFVCNVTQSPTLLALCNVDSVCVCALSGVLLVVLSKTVSPLRLSRTVRLVLFQVIHSLDLE